MARLSAGRQRGGPARISQAEILFFGRVIPYKRRKRLQEIRKYAVSR